MVKNKIIQAMFQGFQKYLKRRNAASLIYFHRDYKCFAGGHLKVFHYFEHVLSSKKYRALVYFTPESIDDGDNPFRNRKDFLLNLWEPEKAGILFLAGMDWQSIPENQRDFFSVPIVNLIQHVRHADPDLPLYRFLSHRAVRICVSPEVQEAIESTDCVNGPVFTIPNGIDTSHFPATLPFHNRPINLLIMGMKGHIEALKLSTQLTEMGITHKIENQRIPRAHYLSLLAQSKTAVLLPHEKEGFYLPALEGMALGCTVICPDCIGNRSFCIDGYNMFRPRYHIEEILLSIKQAMEMDDFKRENMEKAAGETVRKHSLGVEKKSFMKILSNVHQLYFQKK